MLKEVFANLSWLDYGLLVLAAWWVYDHGVGPAIANAKAFVASTGGAAIARIEALEVQVFGATQAPAKPAPAAKPTPATLAASTAVAKQMLANAAASQAPHQ